MSRLSNILILLLLSAANLSAQSTTWQKYYHFSRSESPDFIVEDIDGGFLMTANYGEPVAYVYLVKLDKYGVVQWTKPLTPESGWITSFVKSGDNDFYLTDYYLNRMNLLHFNRNGDIIWSKKYYDNASNYSPYRVYPLSGGNYILQGGLFKDSIRFPKSSQKVVIEKFNANHQRIWGDTITNIGYASIYDIEQGKNNTIMLCGAAYFNEHYFYSQGLLLMIDTTGKIINNIVYPFNKDSSELFQYVTQLRNGDIILQSSAGGRFDSYFTRIDSNGHLLNHYDMPFINSYGGIIADEDSIFHFNVIGLNGPLVLVKYDTGFNILHYDIYSNKPWFNDGSCQILRTSDGGILLLGGWMFDNGYPADNYTDITIIKLDNEGKIKEAPINEHDECLHVYPNPAGQYIHFDNMYQPDSTLVFSSPDSSSYTVSHIYNLEIYDARGRLIISYPHIEINGVQKDISFLASGLYLYRIYDDKKAFCSGKFIKM